MLQDMVLPDEQLVSTDLTGDDKNAHFASCLKDEGFEFFKAKPYQWMYQLPIALLIS